MFNGNFINDLDPNMLDLSGGGIYTKISLDPTKTNFISSNFQDYLQNGVLSSSNNVLTLNTSNSSSYIDITPYKGIILNSFFFKSTTELFEITPRDIYNINNSIANLGQIQTELASQNAKINAIYGTAGSSSGYNLTDLENSITQLTSGSMTISGTKNFTSSPTIPLPSGNTDAANKQYVDNNFVDKSTSQSINGVKSFNSPPNVPLPVNNSDVANKKYVDNIKNDILSQMQNMYNEILNKINDLTNKVNQNTQNITNLTNKVNQNTQNITNLTNKVNQNTQNITSLSQRVALIDTQINYLNTEIDAIYGSVGYQQGVDLTTLNDKININIRDIANLKNASSNIPSNLQNTINALQASVTQNTNNLSSIIGSMPVVNSNNNLHALNQRISQCESNVLSNADNISILQNRQGAIVSICNTLKDSYIVNSTQSFTLDSNGFTRINLQNYITSPAYSSYNDNIISIVPYDIMATTSSGEYGTVSASWVDFEDQKNVNIRLQGLSGMPVANQSVKIFYIAKNPAANITIPPF